MDSGLKLSGNEIGLIDFRIFEDRNGVQYEGIYGINVAKVKEIIQLPETTQLPASPDYIVGVFDLRGTVIPLVDLAIWIGIKDTEAQVDIGMKRVIVAEFSNFQMGFIVHEAKLIRRINWSDVDPATMFSSTNVERRKITGIVRIENNLTLLILDLESILEGLDFYSDEKINKSNLSVHEVKKFNGNILIVDDSVIARNLIKKHLKNMGFEVLEARDGKEGLDMLDNLYEIHKENIINFLSLIVSDVEMPKMDGFNFVEQVKRDSRFSSIPVIFNSSICDKYSEKRSKDIGAHGYLVKFDANIFYEEIVKIME